MIVFYNVRRQGHHEIWNIQPEIYNVASSLYINVQSFTWQHVHAVYVQGQLMALLQWTMMQRSAVGSINRINYGRQGIYTYTIDSHLQQPITAIGIITSDKLPVQIYRPRRDG